MRRRARTPKEHSTSGVPDVRIAKKENLASYSCDRPAVMIDQSIDSLTIGR